jgi:hypothetical protein
MDFCGLAAARNAYQRAFSPFFAPAAC